MRQKKTKTETRLGLSLGQLAESETANFFARYSESAERVAVLVLEKIRAWNKRSLK